MFLVLSACDDAPEAPTPPAAATSTAGPVVTGEAGEAVAEPEQADSVGVGVTSDESPILVEAAKELSKSTAKTVPVPAPMPNGARPLTAEEQNLVIDSVLQARARQQAEGLGTGRVIVNGAWPYSGYSKIAPDPAAAIEARLVAVDVTISGHTPYFDIDDIEIVDGASLMSYGSDPHAEPLRSDGTLPASGEELPEAPAPARWLLIYAFPKATPRFQLYYWGKALTPSPLAFGEKGISLPYPPTE